MVSAIPCFFCFLRCDEEALTGNRGSGLLRGELNVKRLLTRGNDGRKSAARGTRSAQKIVVAAGRTPIEISARHRGPDDGGRASHSTALPLFLQRGSTHRPEEKPLFQDIGVCR